MEASPVRFFAAEGFPGHISLVKGVSALLLLIESYKHLWKTLNLLGHLKLQTVLHPGKGEKGKFVSLLFRDLKFQASFIPKDKLAYYTKEGASRTGSI